MRLPLAFVGDEEEEEISQIGLSIHRALMLSLKMAVSTRSEFTLMTLAVLIAAPAFAATVFVDGSANIFAAGHASPSAPAGGGAGSLPTSVVLGTGGNIVNFAISGTVTYNGGGNFYGADGGQYIGAATNISSFGGISGIQHDSRTMFLVGVFLDGTEPSGFGPSILDATNDSFPSLNPELNQAFFIGDGLTGTGSGSTQQFHIPTGATRLFLGFADGVDFSGPHGNYGDNSGTLTVDVSQVPEPSKTLLLFVGLAMAGMNRRRTRP